MLGKITCFLVAVSGLTLGTWGLYESSKTIGTIVMANGVPLEERELENIINNVNLKSDLLEFLDGRESTTTKLQERCREVSRFRRWNPDYSRLSHLYRSLCTRQLRKNA